MMHLLDAPGAGREGRLNMRREVLFPQQTRPLVATDPSIFYGWNKNEGFRKNAPQEPLPGSGGVGEIRRSERRYPEAGAVLCSNRDNYDRQDRLPLRRTLLKGFWS